MQAFRSREQIDLLLDTAHEAMVQSFSVPARDRYQLVVEYPASAMRILDTGLDIPRTEKFVLVEVISRLRTRSAKVDFYKRLAAALDEKCDISSSDLMVTFVENTDEDWSFGGGTAQFLTGELR